MHKCSSYFYILSKIEITIKRKNVKEVIYFLKINTKQIKLLNEKHLEATNAPLYVKE